MLYRIGYALCIIFSCIVMPWQATLLFVIAGFFMFDYWFEGIIWALYTDVVFTYAADGMQYWFTIATLLLYISIHWLKQHLFSYVSRN